MNKNNLFLQQYVDHKLNSIRCDMDDLSDYLENYTDDEHLLYIELLHEWKVDPQYFIMKFNPTETQLREAIMQSKMLDVLAERYKQAVIKCIPKDILYNVMDEEKSYIKIKQVEIQNNKAKQSALKKLKKANLTLAEKKAL